MIRWPSGRDVALFTVLAFAVFMGASGVWESPCGPDFPLTLDVAGWLLFLGAGYCVGLALIGGE